MKQKQLDDLEAEEGSFSDDADDALDSSDSSEEEKMNDVNEIINDEFDDRFDSSKKKSEVKKSEKSEVEKNSDFKKEKNEEKKSGWNWDEEEAKPEKSNFTWKVVSGILLVLLIVAVYTDGFNFTGAATVKSLTLVEAEDKVLDYVNNYLLKPPFTAEVKSSEELAALFKITLEVGGQEIDSYLTKEGKFFFPQGFDLEAAPALESAAELVDVSIDDDPVKGEANAPVTLVEFSDFQCPFCQKGWEVIKQVETDYLKAGKVKIVFRDFPLDFHPQARPAALAAECAHEQGKFWEYHDLLFKNQETLGTANFQKWAADLGLDTKKFNDCLSSEKYKDEVEKDLADGQKYGVSGTPAFFVNGRLISGAQPYSVFKQAIEEALKSSAEKAKPSVSGTKETETKEPESVSPPEIVSEAKEITLTIKKWRFDPTSIEVAQGDKIKLAVTSQFDSKFVLPQFNLEKEILAGKTETFEFTANQKGTFPFSCGDYCIKTYGQVQGGALKGELIVK